MSESIKEVIFELLQFRRAPFEETEIFARLKHNAALCPKFQARLDSIRDAFYKYQKITYDIQGPRDQGTDVLIRQTIDNQDYFICFQIKSDDDLKSKDYLKDLKAQLFDSRRKFGHIQNYYIVLCCNLNDKTSSGVSAINRQNKEKIRVIEADFSTEPGVHIIEPEYALSFLKLSLIHIDATIKSKLGSEDVILRMGMEMVSELTPTERAILFQCIVEAIYDGNNSVTVQKLARTPAIHEVYSGVPDYDRDWFFFDESSWEDNHDENYEEPIRGFNLDRRIMMDLDYLENVVIERDLDGSYRLHIRNVQPLALLLMDGHLRFGRAEKDLVDYMMSLFGRMKGYEPQDVPI